jgi:hypothetical protein
MWSRWFRPAEQSHRHLIVSRRAFSFTTGCFFTSVAAFGAKSNAREEVGMCSGSNNRAYWVQLNPGVERFFLLPRVCRFRSRLGSIAVTGLDAGSETAGICQEGIFTSSMPQRHKLESANQGKIVRGGPSGRNSCAARSQYARWPADPVLHSSETEDVDYKVNMQLIRQ